MQVTLEISGGSRHKSATKKDIQKNIDTIDYVNGLSGMRVVDIISLSDTKSILSEIMRQLPCQ